MNGAAMLMAAGAFAGAISTSEVSGVNAEICREHAFDASGLSIKLPEGYRLRTGSSGLGVGSLCFLQFSTFIVDGARVHGNGSLSAAFWWIAAEGPPHADMRGKARWVQAGSWYARGNLDQERVRRTDPMAQFVEVDVKQVGADTWQLRLVLPTETISADVRVTTPATPSKSPQPSFMSVPMSGDSADLFSVYAYAGHLHRKAEGTWRADGSGIFSASFAMPGESSASETVFQEGWTARSGLYRFSSGRRP